MPRIYLTFALLLTGYFLSAQNQPNVYTISLDHMLITVLPFYAVTLLGLGLFIHKLMRPAFPSKWMYMCVTIGILGAGVIAVQFHNVRSEQLPSAQIDSSADMTGIPEDIQARIRERELSDTKETISNFWIVAIPNLNTL